MLLHVAVVVVVVVVVVVDVDVLMRLQKTFFTVGQIDFGPKKKTNDSGFGSFRFFYFAAKKKF